MRKTTYFLIFIIIIAAFLRLYGLANGDVVSDEALYAFRAIGPMDFDAAPKQTTPLEWLDPEIPSWTKFSFHDHPPLVFWVQYFSIGIFGENNFAYRFPSAVFGIASVLLIYFIGKILYWRNVGLVAAAIFAVTLNHVYISRIGLQEAQVIFFMLFAVYLFLKALNRDWHFLWLGIVMGLAFLTKYTTFILIPIFFAYLLFFRRDLLRNKKLLVGVVLAVLVFSPVIIYNVQLYRTAGHFDFQLSYVFGQDPDVWQSAPGKEIGTVGDRIMQFFPRLAATHSWLFLSLVGISIVFFLWGGIRAFKEVLHAHGFLLITFLFLGVFIIAMIGPSFRFLTMLTPFLVLPVALLFDALYYYKITKSGFTERKKIPSAVKYPVVGLLVGFLLFEVVYAANNHLTDYPRGPYPWFSSKTRQETYSWGYNELDAFFEKEFEGKLPARLFGMQYKFLEDIRQQSINRAYQAGGEPSPALIVYAGEFQKFAKLMTLDRLHFYHGWPVVSLDEYQAIREAEGEDFYEQAGFGVTYFVFSANFVPSSEVAGELTDSTPESITNRRGEEVFFVYTVL